MRTALVCLAVAATVATSGCVTDDNLDAARQYAQAATDAATEAESMVARLAAVEAASRAALDQAAADIAELEMTDEAREAALADLAVLREQVESLGADLAEARDEASQAIAQARDAAEAIATAGTPDEANAAIVQGLTTAASAAAPQYAGLIALGGTLVSAIAGAFAASKRKDGQIRKIVQSVDQAKVRNDEDGYLRVSPALLTIAQDASGVREIVARHRATK